MLTGLNLRMFLVPFVMLMPIILFFYREEVQMRGFAVVAVIQGATTSIINTLLESLYLFEVGQINKYGSCIFCCFQENFGCI